MADLHNLGSYNTLEEVWKLLPYGGCPGDYVYIAGEQIYWNEYRNVWGNPDAAVSTDPTQTINGDLTVTKDLAVGEHTLGNTAKYNSLEVDNILINSDPFAAKDHNHDLTYSNIGHVHDYAPKSHRHNVGDIDGIGEVQGGGNVDIVTDYDTDIPSNSNIPSMLRLLKELSENNEALAEMFLRKDIPNSAAELITFLKGIISEDTSYISQLIVGGTSDTVSSGLTEISSEEDTDVVVPSLQETASEIDGSTLGSLTNVNEEVDVQDAQDVFLVKSAGSDKWGKRNVKDFTGKDGVIAYPTIFLNPLTGRLVLRVPTNNYENRFAVRNGHLMLIQS